MIITSICFQTVINPFSTNVPFHFNAQSAIAYSKLTIETLEQGATYVQC